MDKDLDILFCNTSKGQGHFGSAFSIFHQHVVIANFD